MLSDLCQSTDAMGLEASMGRRMGTGSAQEWKQRSEQALGRDWGYATVATTGAASIPRSEPLSGLVLESVCWEAVLGYRRVQWMAVPTMVEVLGRSMESSLVFVLDCGWVRVLACETDRELAQVSVSRTAQPNLDEAWARVWVQDSALKSARV